MSPGVEHSFAIYLRLYGEEEGVESPMFMLYAHEI